jgi:fructose-1,6-bisphosphatase/inositol monophosphatase family enzyme
MLDPSTFEARLARVIGRETDDNILYQFDLDMEALCIKVLSEFRIGGRLFSEESGWRDLGQGGDFRIVCDPFDNSFLAARGFREASVAITVADRKGGFVCSAIGDLSTNRTYYADADGAFILDSPGRPERRPAHPSCVTRIHDAFIVQPAFLRTGREDVLTNNQLVEGARYFLNNDGVILFGRLADGRIDAYVDTVIGQPLYEIPCLMIVARAGGVVTDENGRLFDFKRIIDRMENEPTSRFRVVAASTTELHAEILSAL